MGFAVAMLRDDPSSKAVWSDGADGALLGGLHLAAALGWLPNGP